MMLVHLSARAQDSTMERYSKLPHADISTDVFGGADPTHTSQGVLVICETDTDVSYYPNAASTIASLVESPSFQEKTHFHMCPIFAVRSANSKDTVYIGTPKFDDIECRHYMGAFEGRVDSQGIAIYNPREPMYENYWGPVPRVLPLSVRYSDDIDIEALIPQKGWLSWFRIYGDKKLVPFEDVSGFLHAGNSVSPVDSFGIVHVSYDSLYEYRQRILGAKVKTSFHDEE